MTRLLISIGLSAGIITAIDGWKYLAIVVESIARLNAVLAHASQVIR